MKKILCFIMSIIVIATFSISTNASSFDNADNLTVTGSHSEDDLFCDGFYYHILDDGTAEITEYVGTEKILVVSGTIDEYVVSSIGNNAFMNNEYLEEINIPDSIGKLGSSSFYGCSNLKTVSLPQNLSCLESQLFAECVSLETVPIPDTITNIGSGAFEHCYSLKTITIPESVVIIEGAAFRDCLNLESVYITDLASWCNIDFISPRDNPLSFARNLYLDDKLLSDVIVPEGVKTIRDYAFYGCNMETLSIPKTVTNMGKDAFVDCNSLREISVDKSNSNYTSINGCLFDKEVNTLIHYPAAREDAVFHIPEGVIEIAEYAFYNSKDLQELDIPNSIKTIKPYAFMNCANLREINLHEGLVHIDYMSFAYCSSLTEITIPGSIEFFGGHGATFGGCTSLQKVTFAEGLKYIGAYAFVDCTNLNTITIPKSLERIGTGAFLDCNNLAEVYYNSSEKDWNKLQGTVFVTPISTKAEKDPNIHYAVDSKYLLGDSDGDDSVTIVDATVIQRHLAEIPTAVYIEAAADADQDGSVTIIDATAIQRWLAELPTHEGIGEIFV